VSDQVPHGIEVRPTYVAGAWLQSGEIFMLRLLGKEEFEAH
jgi:hypothetical protein